MHSFKIRNSLPRCDDTRTRPIAACSLVVRDCEQRNRVWRRIAVKQLVVGQYQIDNLFVSEFVGRAFVRSSVQRKFRHLFDPHKTGVALGGQLSEGQPFAHYGCQDAAEPSAVRCLALVIPERVHGEHKES